MGRPGVACEYDANMAPDSGIRANAERSKTSRFRKLTPLAIAGALRALHQCVVRARWVRSSIG